MICCAQICILNIFDYGMHEYNNCQEKFKTARTETVLHRIFSISEKGLTFTSFNLCMEFLSLKSINAMTRRLPFRIKKLAKTQRRIEEENQKLYMDNNGFQGVAGVLDLFGRHLFSITG